MNNPTDTNQASELYELCKEVYKRTRWEDTTADYMYKMVIYNRRGLFDDVWYEWTISKYLYNKDKQWAIRNAKHYCVKIENE